MCLHSAAAHDGGRCCSAIRPRPRSPACRSGDVVEAKGGLGDVHDDHHVDVALVGGLGGATPSLASLVVVSVVSLCQQSGCFCCFSAACSLLLPLLALTRSSFTQLHTSVEGDRSRPFLNPSPNIIPGRVSPSGPMRRGVRVRVLHPHLREPSKGLLTGPRRRAFRVSCASVACGGVPRARTHYCLGGQACACATLRLY